MTSHRAVREIADAIVTHLPGIWRGLDEWEYGATYRDDEGLGLGFSRPVGCSRPRAYGVAPEFQRYRTWRDWGVLPYDAPNPEATFNPDRDPAAVAREIVRKVLEPCRPLFEAAQQKREETRAALTRAAGVADRVVGVLEVRRCSETGSDRHRLSSYGSEPFGILEFDIEAHSRGSVKLSHLTDAEILALAEWIAERRKAEGAGS